MLDLLGLLGGIITVALIGVLIDWLLESLLRDRPTLRHLLAGLISILPLVVITLSVTGSDVKKVEDSSPSVKATSPVINVENAGSVDETIRLGKGALQDVVYSPRGDMVAAASSIGVYLYESETMREVRFFETEAWVHEVAFSPDSTLLVSASSSVHVWRISDGTLLYELSVDSPPMYCIAFSPDGERLASGGWNGSIHVWQISDGSLLYQQPGTDESVQKLTFSSDGRLLAAGLGNNSVLLWNTETGELMHTLEGHTERLRHIIFSPENEIVATGAQDGTLRVWRTTDGSLLHTLQLDVWAPFAMAFSVDGKFIASGSVSIRIWRVTDGKLMHTLDGQDEQNDAVLSIAFAPNGIMASAGRDRKIRIWDFNEGTLLKTLLRHENSVIDLEFDPEFQNITSLGQDGIICSWRISDGALLHVTDRRPGAIRSVAISPNGEFVASGGDDNLIRVWKLANQTIVHTLDGHTDEVRCVAFSPDGTTIASGANDNLILLWRMTDGELIQAFEGHTDWVADLDFSSDGTKLASASEDGTVNIWRIQDGELLMSFEQQSEAHAVDFSSSGELLASGDWYGTKIWQVQEGALLHSLQSNSEFLFVQSVEFSPDDSVLAVGSWGGGMQLWQISDSSLLRTMEANVGEANRVNSVAFSSDGGIIASGAVSDSVIRLWRTEDGRLLNNLYGHTAMVYSVDFSSDDTKLVSGCRDGTVRIWTVVR